MTSFSKHRWLGLSKRILCGGWLLRVVMFMGLLHDSKSHGITINAVYYASCAREVGVIIDVDNDHVALLSVSGVITKIKRFDIIYLAQYPVSEVPIAKISGGDKVPGTVIETLYNDEIVELVRGWPVNFSESKISFLTLEGSETVINRDSIWNVDRTGFAHQQILRQPARNRYQFLHPYPFSHCPDDAPKNPEGIQEVSSQNLEIVYPDQLLGQQLTIKSELDRLMEGYKKITSYRADRWFYPVPQLYDNSTTLSIWYNYGARHGKSKRRSNSMVPALRGSISDGPFGFQRVMVTGAAPLDFSVHEEPQTQFYYRLKADYIHFSYFYDIDRFLIGEESYKWRKPDLLTHDDRMNEIHHLSAGFDYEHWAIGVTLAALQYGVRHEESFFVHRAQDYVRFDASYEDRYLLAQVFLGNAFDSKESAQEQQRREGGNETDEGDKNEPEAVKAAREAIALAEELKPSFTAKIDTLRFNLTLKQYLGKPLLSVIYRKLRFYLQEDQNQENEISYASNSWTVALYLQSKIDEEIGIAGYLALEHQNQRSGASFYEHQDQRFFPKAGIQWSLSF